MLFNSGKEQLVELEQPTYNSLHDRLSQNNNNPISSTRAIGFTPLHGGFVIFHAAEVAYVELVKTNKVSTNPLNCPYHYDNPLN